MATAARELRAALANRSRRSTDPPHLAGVQLQGSWSRQFGHFTPRDESAALTHLAFTVVRRRDDATAHALVDYTSRGHACSGSARQSSEAVVQPAFGVVLPTPSSRLADADAEVVEVYVGAVVGDPMAGDGWRPTWIGQGRLASVSTCLAYSLSAPQSECTKYSTITRDRPDLRRAAALTQNTGSAPRHTLPSRFLRWRRHASKPLRVVDRFLVPNSVSVLF